MNCLTSADLERYESGILDQAARSGIRTHLEGCPSCQSSYDQFRKKKSAAAVTIATDIRTVHTPTAIVDDSDSSTVNIRYPRIGGYQITGVLGQGGMGIVYKAIQAKLSRAVALKVLPAMIGSANPAAVQRFRREATAAARLHHTNIIPIYDFGESADAYYYAMEMVIGEPLNVLVDRIATQGISNPTAGQIAQILTNVSLGSMSMGGQDPSTVDQSAVIGGSGGLSARGRTYFRLVAKWMSDAAEALHYAHGQGIIHRDIKPANLILASDGRIMVADFGLAKSADEQTVTVTGTLVGTLRYLSPEQAMARRMRVDHRTDIYSLGATLYELLCFHPAFPGNDEKEILGAVITRDPPSPRKVNNHVPQELETICNKCMEKSAESRYDTARALADDLRRYINDLPIVAKRPGPIQRVWKFSRRHRIPIAAIAAVVLLAATGVLWRRETVRRRLAQVQSRIAQIQSLRESATTFVQLNRWAEAENDLRAALKIDPDHTETLLTLAWLKLEHYRAVPAQADPKSQEEAVEICNRVLAIQPDNIHVLGYLGIALRRLQRYSEAIDVLRRALEIDPRAYASWSNLGALHAVMGDLTQAEEYLRKGTELGGVEPDEWHAAVWRNRATLELFLRKPETAGHIANALRCHSSDVQSWVLRAKMNLELVSGVNVDEALDDAKHADRIADFKDAHAKRMRALTHLAKGEDAQAMEQAKAALELNDEPSILHLILAVAEARSGRTEKAREHLDQADQNWPLALRNPGAHTAHATTGDLWIESADDRLRLLEQAKAKLVLHQP